MCDTCCAHPSAVTPVLVAASRGSLHFFTRDRISLLWREVCWVKYRELLLKTQDHKGLLGHLVPSPALVKQSVHKTPMIAIQCFPLWHCFVLLDCSKCYSDLWSKFIHGDLWVLCHFWTSTFSSYVQQYMLVLCNCIFLFSIFLTIWEALNTSLVDRTHLSSV